MIQNLKIENFQSHKKTELDLHPGVNVVVGPSDSGKTAIIRALRWLVWNRPAGETFRSNWGGDTSVIATIDGTEIRRVRSKENAYAVGKPGGEYQIFLALQHGVPEEIQKLLNINEINLQQQLDAPFLITESPGTVAAHFNHIANLEKIDESLKSIQGDVRNLSQTKKLQEESLKAHEERLEEFNYLGDAERDLEALEEMQRQHTKLSDQRNELEILVEEIIRVQIDINEIETPIGVESEVDHILELMDELTEVEGDADYLEQHLLNMQELQNQLDELDVVLGVEGDVEKIEELIIDNQATEYDRAHLNKAIESYELSKTSHKELIEELNVLEEKFHDELGDTCPLCGTNLQNNE